MSAIVHKIGDSCKGTSGWACDSARGQRNSVAAVVFVAMHKSGRWMSVYPWPLAFLGRLFHLLHDCFYVQLSTAGLDLKAPVLQAA